MFTAYKTDSNQAQKSGQENKQQIHLLCRSCEYHPVHDKKQGQTGLIQVVTGQGYLIRQEVTDSAFPAWKNQWSTLKLSQAVETRYIKSGQTMLQPQN